MRTKTLLAPLACWILFISLVASGAIAAPDTAGDTLWQQFRDPRPEYGPVPIWWWSGDPLDPARLRWQLEQMVRGGVHNAIVLNLAPSGPLYGSDADDPRFLSEEWWQIFEGVLREAKRLGVRIWFYDQFGFSGAGLQARLVREHPECAGWDIAALRRDANGPVELRLSSPPGTSALAAFIVRIGGGEVREVPIDTATRSAQFEVPRGGWQAILLYTRRSGFDYLNSRASGLLLDTVHGEMERRVGSYLGDVIPGSFQDELPRMPRWTGDFLEEFRTRKGYDLAPLLPALCTDIGRRTPKVRCDYFDVAASLAEEAFFQPLFEWHERRGMICGMDQMVRDGDPIRGQEFYIDYFRTQRWFQAPGNDQHGNAKVNSSIAHLYGRPRVWLEGFYGSGWGQTLEELTHTLTGTWLTQGSNLYDPHAFYYSTHGGWWEWAPPCTSFRQPYWAHYRQFADYVSRLCFLLSQGVHVCDHAIVYPSATVQADTTLLEGPGEQAKQARDAFWATHRALQGAERDFDVIDEASIGRAEVNNGRLCVSGERYRVLIFPATRTVKRRSLSQALALVESGGIACAIGDLPRDSAEAGANDRQVAELVQKVWGLRADEPTEALSSAHIRRHPGGGVGLFVPAADFLPQQLDEFLAPDATGGAKCVHRRIDGRDFYYAYSTARRAQVKLRTRGRPVLWDALSGRRTNLASYRVTKDGTELIIPFDSAPGVFVEVVPERSPRGVLIGKTTLDRITEIAERPGSVGIRGYARRHMIRAEALTAAGERFAASEFVNDLPEPIELSGLWRCDLRPTLDNRWGDFAWPPSQGPVPVEIREFAYAEESDQSGTELGWHRPEFDDSSWERVRYSFGPYAWAIGPLRGGEDAAESILSALQGGCFGPPPAVSGQSWRPCVFSLRYGIEKDPAYGRWLGPKSHVLRDFIDLGEAPEGSRAYVYTNVLSDKLQAAELGLGQHWRRVWWRGKLVAIADQPAQTRRRLPVVVAEGANPLLIELTYPRNGRLRTHFFLAGSSHGEESQPKWIWLVGDPNMRRKAVFVRSFKLEQGPEKARLRITADNVYRVIVNGRVIGADGGYETHFWQSAESYDVVDVLKVGANQIQVEAENLGGIAGLLATLEIRLAGGESLHVVTDGSWQGVEVGGDGGLEGVSVVQELGGEPWGDIAGFGTPNRSGPTLPEAGFIDGRTPAADLPVVLDAWPGRRPPVVWFRFTVPPGARRLLTDIRGKATLYVDGRELPPTEDGQYYLPSAESAAPRVCAVCVVQTHGAYAGAAMHGPVRVECGPGQINLGSWTTQGLATYSGGLVYSREVTLPAVPEGALVLLDLGQVRGTVEAWINGVRAGVRLWRPYEFDVTQLMRPGRNWLALKVFNTLGPHYCQVLPTPYVYRGQRLSGILGPVRLYIMPRVELRLSPVSSSQDSAGPGRRNLVNWADPARGATVRASSEHASGNYPAASVLLGDVSGQGWEHGSGWNDGTQDVLPDWLEISLGQARSVERVEIYTLPPAIQYGVRDVSLEVYVKDRWQELDAVSGNLDARIVFEFPQLKIEKLRLVVTGVNSNDGYSRILAVRVYGGK